MEEEARRSRAENNSWARCKRHIPFALDRQHGKGVKASGQDHSHGGESTRSRAAGPPGRRDSSSRWRGLINLS
jgi:hypothetical protein